LAKIEKTKTKKTKKNSKQKWGFAQRLCVILMMAYAIHSNVRHLGLFFIYDKVDISK
jgi:hypothetical protein